MADDIRYLHIRRFMDRIRGTDLTTGRPVMFTAQEVQNLAADITKLLLDTQQAPLAPVTQEAPTVITGGGFRR